MMKLHLDTTNYVSLSPPYSLCVDILSLFSCIVVQSYLAFPVLSSPFCGELAPYQADFLVQLWCELLQLLLLGNWELL